MANSKYYTERNAYDTFPLKDEVSLEQFLLIVRTFFYQLMLAVVDEGKVFWFPNQLGVFGVFKTKTKGKMIDWNYYKQTGDKIMVKNLHSQGLMAKIAWIMRWPKFNIGDTYVNNVYNFKATRTFTRYLAAKIKKENIIHKYYDYDN